MPEIGVYQPVAERGRQCGAVLGRHQEAGSATFARLAQSLRQPTDRRRDDRQPTSQSLGDHHSVGLSARGQHQHVGRSVGVGQVVADLHARKTDPVTDPGYFGLKPQAFDEHRVAVERPDTDAPPRQIRGGGQRSEQYPCAS